MSRLNRIRNIQATEPKIRIISCYYEGACLHKKYFINDGVSLIVRPIIIRGCESIYKIVVDHGESLGPLFNINICSESTFRSPDSHMVRGKLERGIRGRMEQDVRDHHMRLYPVSYINVINVGPTVVNPTLRLYCI